MITLEDITKKAKLLAEEAKEEVLSKCDGRSLVDFCLYIEKYSIKIGDWIMEETRKDSNQLIGKVDNDVEIEFHQIPFDIEKAQNGADVVTKGGHKVTIYDYKYQESCTERILIAGKIEDQNGDTISFWDKDGIKVDTEERIFDLNIIEEVKYEDRWIIHNGHECCCTLYKTETAAEKLREDYIEETGGRCKCEIIKIKVRV